MNLKKMAAFVLAMVILVTGVNVTPAAAKEAEKETEVSATETAEEKTVSSFSLSDIISDSASSGYSTISEDKVPLSATVSDLKKDELKSKELEEQAQAEAEKAQKEAEKKAKKKYESDLRLLATIIYCEAGGQCYAGRLAVGAVVMNRVNSSYYPNTVKGVIWQPYQFGPVRQGKMAREMRYYDQGLYKYPERSGSLKAAKDILAGKYTVEYNGRTVDLKKYTNFNGHLSNAKIRISGHDFA